jgi:zinc transport system substrate-binding protein
MVAILILWYRRATMRARIVLTAVGAATLALAAGCGGGEESASGEPEVVAAFYPIAYGAERIAPDADVRNLTPAGAEPHDLELSARDVERARDADLVLYLGGGFMPALEDAVAGSENAVDLLGDAGTEPADDNGARDPHVWLDPTRYAALVRNVAQALSRPGAGDGLVAELRELDREYRRGLTTCKRRELVTSHAAFGRLAAAYGLRQVALTGISPEAEPSPRELEELVRTVEATGATTVFFEPLVSHELAETVAHEAGVATAELDPIESLTDEQIAAGADYFSVMRDNLTALRAALGCS